MKNILIVESSRDNLGNSYAYFSDINTITDPQMKQVVMDAINKSNVSHVDKPNPYNSNFRNWLLTRDGFILSNYLGYYFSNISTENYKSKQVDHIIEHILE